jgi:hypothetical protein
MKGFKQTPPDADGDSRAVQVGGGGVAQRAGGKRQGVLVVVWDDERIIMAVTWRMGGCGWGACVFWLGEYQLPRPCVCWYV